MLNLDEFINSLTSTLKTFAIEIKVSMELCFIRAPTRNCRFIFIEFLAIHLLVLPCSAKTTFNLFIGFEFVFISTSCKYKHFTKHELVSLKRCSNCTLWQVLVYVLTYVS